MTNAVAVRETTAVTPAQFNDALIKAVGWDRVPAEQRALALHICERYGLDPMMRHVVMVEGKPYITRDGLLHVAHRSGQFDGIEVTDPELGETHWKARATVYRKDMSRGFTYSGRYPKAGGNAKYAPEMATKVAEVMALRRAFDVAAPVIEERWDLDEERPDNVVRTPVPLAAKVAARRAEVEARSIDTPAPAAPVTGEAVGANAASPSDTTPVAEDAGVQGEVGDSAPSPSTETFRCEAMSPYDVPSQCGKAKGHKGVHANRDRETWS